MELLEGTQCDELFVLPALSIGSSCCMVLRYFCRVKDSITGEFVGAFKAGYATVTVQVLFRFFAITGASIRFFSLVRMGGVRDGEKNFWRVFGSQVSMLLFS